MHFKIVHCTSSQKSILRYQNRCYSPFDFYRPTIKYYYKIHLFINYNFYFMNHICMPLRTLQVSFGILLLEIKKFSIRFNAKFLPFLQGRKCFIEKSTSTVNNNINHVLFMQILIHHMIGHLKITLTCP